jgi:hypothetical protein
MKKMVLAGLMLGLAYAASAIDFNIDARTDLTYTSFMKNSAYDDMASRQTMTAVNAYEKLVVKANAKTDQVKFVFNGRLYGYPATEKLDLIIDNAYFSFEAGPFVVFTGKQRMKWGTGYFFNPTDSLQPAKTDIFRPTEDLEGIYALRAEFTNEIVTPSLIIIPHMQGIYPEIYRDFDFAIQLYKLAGTCDMYLNYIYSYDSGRRQAGAAISWDIGLIVLNAEAALKQASWYSASNQAYDCNFVIGFSKMLSDEMSVFAEYYRNNSGIDNYGYAGKVAMNIFPVILDKKDYAAYSMSYTWDNRLAFGLTGIHGFDDGTSFLLPSIGYVENQNFDVMISLLQNFTGAGIKEGNYLTPFYSALELRINAYF